MNLKVEGAESELPGYGSRSGDQENVEMSWEDQSWEERMVDPS